MKNNIINKKNILNKYNNFVDNLINDFYKDNNLDSDLSISEIAELPEFKLEYYAIDYIAALVDFSDVIYNDSKITNLIVFHNGESAICNLDIEFSGQEELNNFFSILNSVDLTDILLSVYYKIYIDITNCGGDSDSYNDCLHILSIQLNVRKEKEGLRLTW